jgi:hypothetical protein
LGVEIFGGGKGHYGAAGPAAVASACRIASSAKPCSSDQAAALRVQRRDPAWLFLPQASAEQVAEQLVVTPPAAHISTRDIAPCHEPPRA